MLAGHRKVAEALASGLPSESMNAIVAGARRFGAIGTGLPTTKLRV
jgi:hypothetical protein